MNTHNPMAFFRTLAPYHAETVQRAESAEPCARCGPLSSESLFRGAFEIGIDHDGSLYRLKITRQGKLILNK